MNRRLLRWAPAVVVPVAIAAGVVVVPLAAGAADLPVRSPEDVVRLVASSDTATFSGTVEQSSELGLPSLPAGVGGTTSGSGSGSGSGDGEQSILELLTGDHTAKVYVDGAGKQRVQLLDQLAERDAVRDGSSVWLYDSKTDRATHLGLGAHGGDVPEATPTPLGTTPQALAERFLAAVDPSTEVALAKPSTVAGRDAYTLVLTPRTDATLVGSVRIAVDGATGIPLRVQVAARGASAPAFEAGFTSFSTDGIPASVFAFTPPASAKVTEQSAPGHPSAKDGSGHPQPQVTGEGWASVVTLPAGSAPAALATDPLFAQLTRSVDGGRALSTTLLSVLVTTDGRVVVGAVPVSALQAAAR